MIHVIIECLDEEYTFTYHGYGETENTAKFNALKNYVNSCNSMYSYVIYLMIKDKKSLSDIELKKIEDWANETHSFTEFGFFVVNNIVDEVKINKDLYSNEEFVYYQDDTLYVYYDDDMHEIKEDSENLDEEEHFKWLYCINGEYPKWAYCYLYNNTSSERFKKDIVKLSGLSVFE